MSLKIVASACLLVALYTSSVKPTDICEEYVQNTWNDSDCDDWPDSYPNCDIYNNLFQGIQNISIKFQTHPQGGTYNINEGVVLYCNLLSIPLCYANGTCPYIYWTFNGQNITANNTHHIKTSMNSSTLMIDEGKWNPGAYACLVEDGVYSLWSVSARVAVPDLIWKNEVYDNYTQFATTTEIGATVMYIARGGSVVLQCKQNLRYIDTDAQFNHHVLPNGYHLISNFKLSENKLSIKLLCVDSPDQLFYQLYYLKDAPSDPVVVASPRSQSVAQGASVILYCIAMSSDAVHYTWYNGTGQTQKVLANETSEVLILDSLQYGGNYTCGVNNDYGGYTLNATITVIGPPKVSIAVVSSNISYTKRSDGDIVINVSAYSLSLQCSSDHNGYNYTWYLGGVRKSDTSILMLDSVLGTVQCMVTNIWGTTTTSLRILSDVINPPGPISITKLDGYMYYMSWPESTPVITDTSIMYQLEMSIPRGNSHVNCYKSTSPSHNFTFNAMPFVYEYSGWNIHFRVKALSQSSQSIYVYRCDSENSISLNEVLPNGILKNGSYNITMDNQEKQHRLSFNFSTLGHSCPIYSPYKSSYTKYALSLNCCQSEPYTIVSNENNTVTYSPDCNLSCFTTCAWAVGIHSKYNDTKISWTAQSQFTVPPVPPWSPPSVTASWTNSTGQAIRIDVNTASDYKCEVDYFSFNSSNCDIDRNGQKNSVTIPLSNKEYWMRCNIDVAYINSAGHSPSANVSLRGPYESELQKFYFNAVKSNSSSVKLSWTVGSVMQLFSSRSYIDRKFTLETAAILNDNTIEQQKLIVDLNQSSTIVPVTSSAFMYYIGANITVNVNGTSYYSFNTTITLDSTSSVVPPSSTVHNYAAGTKKLTSYMIAGFCVLIFIIVILVIVFCIIIKVRTKRDDSSDNNALLPPDGGSDDSDYFPDTTKSVSSVKTEYDELLVAKYLKDAEGPQEIIEHIGCDTDDILVCTANTDDERVQQKLKDLSENDMPLSIYRPTLSISQALPTDYTTKAKETLAQPVVTNSYREKIELVDISTPVNPPQSLDLQWNAPEVAEQTTPISVAQPSTQQVYSSLEDDYIQRDLESSNLVGSTANGYIMSRQYSPPATANYDDINILSTPINTLASLLDQQVSERNYHSPPPLEQRPYSAATESSGFVSPFSSMDSVFQSNTSDTGPSNHLRRLSSGFPDTPLSPDRSKPSAFSFSEAIPMNADYIPDSTVLSSIGSSSIAIDLNTCQTTSRNRSISPQKCNDTTRRVSLPSCTLTHISEVPSKTVPSIKQPPHPDYIPHSDYIPHPVPPQMTTTGINYMSTSKHSKRSSLPVAPLLTEPTNPSVIGLMYTSASEESTATACVSDDVVADITSPSYLPPLLPLSKNSPPPPIQAHFPSTLSSIPSLLQCHQPQDTSVCRPSTLPLYSLHENHRLSPLGQSSSSSSSSQDDASYSLPSTTDSLEQLWTTNSGVSLHLLSQSEVNNNKYV